MSVDTTTTTVVTHARPDWRHDARCRSTDPAVRVDPELFFPTGTSGPALLQIAEAKAICRTCPAISDCLAWALDSGQEAGVAGGLTEDERRAELRRRRRDRQASQ